MLHFCVTFFAGRYMFYDGNKISFSFLHSLIYRLYFCTQDLCLSQNIFSYSVHCTHTHTPKTIFSRTVRKCMYVLEKFVGFSFFVLSPSAKNPFHLQNNIEINMISPLCFSSFKVFSTIFGSKCLVN
jgi:hypothetical protein